MASNAYMTLTTPGTKKLSVCARRIGSRDRMSVIATCNDETIAERIVDALNLLQNKVVELDLPAQRMLSEVREQLKKERDRAHSAELSKREKEREFLDIIRRLENDKIQVARDLAGMTDRCNKLEAAMKEKA